MALDLTSRYPGRFGAKSSAYPQGSFENETALGNNDKSYLEQDWINDLYGFLGAILNDAGEVPNNVVDTGDASQLFDALVTAINDRIAVRDYLGCTIYGQYNHPENTATHHSTGSLGNKAQGSEYSYGAGTSSITIPAGISAGVFKASIGDDVIQIVTPDVINSELFDIRVVKGGSTTVFGTKGYMDSTKPAYIQIQQTQRTIESVGPVSVSPGEVYELQVLINAENTFPSETIFPIPAKLEFLPTSFS